MQNIGLNPIVIEKGNVNITFGYGKKIMFDHIGFLVSEKEQNMICENAERMNWEVNRGERRTFITTPYKFRIELQTNTDVIDSMTSNIKIKELKLDIKKKLLRLIEKKLIMLMYHQNNLFL